MSRDESGRASSSGFHSTSSSNINLRNQNGPIRSSSTISVDKNRNNGSTSQTANQGKAKPDVNRTMSKTRDIAQKVKNTKMKISNFVRGNK